MKNRSSTQKVLIRPAIAMVVMLFGAFPFLAAAAIYYVSQTSGSDSYDGQAASWDGTHGPYKTLVKASAITFQAGDQLLLKCGDTWTDGLELKGNGTAASPAVVSSFGAGNRPKIDRQDPSMANMKRCIYLNGNAYGWKIMNLELADAVNGVWASISGSGHSYLWFENLYIHGCKHGGPFPSSAGDQNNQQIGIRLSGPITGNATITSCTFDDNFVGMTPAMPCYITNCLFTNMEWTGMWYVANGGLVRGNKFMHNCLQNVWCGVSGIGTTGHNWTFEYNEFGETQRPNCNDGEDFDFETANNTDTLRYNLFHETAGAAIMIYDGSNHNSPALNVSIHDNVF
jgi:hypothetical protein